MSGSADNENIAGGSDNLAPEWRRMIDKMRRKHPKRFLRISRKMLNHLCSIGLSSAQQMLAEVEGSDDPLDASSHGGSNVPGARVRLEDSPLMSCGPFDLAAEFLGDDEITERVHKWIMEGKASFFSTVVGDPRCTMPEIADAIRRYNSVLRGRSGLTMSTLKSLRVSTTSTWPRKLSASRISTSCSTR